MPYTGIFVVLEPVGQSSYCNHRNFVPENGGTKSIFRKLWPVLKNLFSTQNSFQMNYSHGTIFSTTITVLIPDPSTHSHFQLLSTLPKFHIANYGNHF